MKIKLKIKGALGIYLEAKGAPGQKSLGNTGLTEPHAILIPLGWLACGGRSGRSDRSAKIFRTNLKEDVSVTSNLKQTIINKDKHIAELESVIKDLDMKDELSQPSRSDL